ncbi:uncharacterized protein LOC127841311 isoform X1 [Dreissena polymorpha]|uniref:uncharacterized protein LOC127841311 isoform X1 n=1 Tax=Dreissena polymorpha TaxID=45954 RepID=UPI0022640C36|nr:uncharacterized protein LOC127841311 isoform X1 [Dreissena polymorpha]
MEKYVSEILNVSDLSVITKKHVRQKYKEHVGRELSTDERDKINNLVLNFVKNLAVKQTGYSDINKSSKTEEVSPGNKENIVGEKTNRRSILKGQVVDADNLYKAKSPGVKTASSAAKSNEHAASSDNQKDPSKSRHKSERVETAKMKEPKSSTLKVSDAIRSLLASDDDSSSVSSLTGSDLEVDEMLEQNKQLDRLREAREKKIKMSVDRKKDSNSNMGIEATKHYSELLNEGNSSDTLSLISDQSPQRKQKQAKVLEKIEKKKLEKRRKSVEEVFGPNTSSMLVNKTPVKYEKHSGAIRTASSEKVIKRKKILISSGSDSDADFSSLKKKQHIKKLSKSLDNIKTKVSKIDSDSEDEPLSALAARTKALKTNTEPKKRKINHSRAHSESGKRVKNWLGKIKSAKVVLNSSCDSLPSLNESEISSLSVSQSDDITERKVIGQKNGHKQSVKKEDRSKRLSTFHKRKSFLMHNPKSKHKFNISALSKGIKGRGRQMSMKEHGIDSVTVQTESSGTENTLVNSSEYELSQDSDQEIKHGNKFVKLKQKSSKSLLTLHSSKLKRKSDVFEIGSTSTESDIGEGLGVKSKKLQQRCSLAGKARVGSVTDRQNMTLKCLDLTEDECVIISEDTCEDDPAELGGKDKHVKHAAVREAALVLEDSPIRKVKRSATANKTKVISSTESDHACPNSDLDLDDSDLDIPLADLKQKNTTTEEDEGETLVKTAVVEESPSLRLMKRICRECRLFVRDDRELKDCRTDEEKIRKCEQMLREIGMEGTPTLEKAEEVRKLKEAAELCAHSVISSETGRVMRKVKSIYARRQISPLKPMKRSSNTITELSESADSDRISDN